mmetsp:Transcript_1993/g.4740  ORF Transcript_1993/g.4740 Transcript_1993/m.4740 type:complete len:218 (+) Transcript_1993:93-746(+)
MQLGLTVVQASIRECWGTTQRGGSFPCLPPHAYSPLLSCASAALFLSTAAWFAGLWLASSSAGMPRRPLSLATLAARAHIASCGSRSGPTKNGGSIAGGIVRLPRNHTGSPRQKQILARVHLQASLLAGKRGTREPSTGKLPRHSTQAQIQTQTIRYGVPSASLSGKLKEGLSQTPAGSPKNPWSTWSKRCLGTRCCRQMMDTGLATMVDRTSCCLD